MAIHGHGHSQNYDVVLTLVKSFADDPWLLAMAILFNLIAIVGLILVAHPLRTEFPHVTLLDLRVTGFTYDEFHAFYDALDVQGCALYEALCQWDLYPFLFSYVISFSVALFQVAQWNGCNVRVTYMAIVMGLADAVETLIFRHGCIVSAERAVPAWLVHVARVAAHIKWMLVSLTWASLVAGTACAVATRGRVSRPSGTRSTPVTGMARHH